MAVAADLLVDAPLASPELALVDPELAAELRRTHSSVEERWLRPPARVEYFSPESGEDAPPQLEAADDAGHASGDAEQPDNDESIVAVPPEQPSMEELPSSSSYPDRPAHEPEQAAVEDSAPPPLMRFDEPSSESDDDTSALRAVAGVVRE